jgi:hypothetical protein
VHPAEPRSHPAAKPEERDHVRHRRPGARCRVPDGSYGSGIGISRRSAENPGSWRSARTRQAGSCLGRLVRTVVDRLWPQVALLELRGNVVDGYLAVLVLIREI